MLKMFLRIHLSCYQMNEKCAVEFSEFCLPKDGKEIKNAEVEIVKSSSVSFYFGFYFNIHLTIPRCEISQRRYVFLISGTLSTRDFKKRSVYADNAI